MKFTFFCLVMLLLTVPVLCLSGEMDTKNVVCSPVEKAMVLDGQVSDWNGIAATKVQVTPAVNGDAKNYTVKTEQSFVNGLVNVLTFGIYAPTTTTITK